SLQDNGDIDHAIANPNNLLGISPTQIYPGTDDMEDCLNHYIQIDWTPGASQTIEVYVDGVLSLTYTANMVAGQFSGTSMVTWGWTGSTGAVLGSNQQIVCTTFAPQIDIDADATYCDGDPIADLTVISATTGTVTWYDDPGLTSIVGTGLTFTPPGGPGTYVYYATETELSLGCEGDPDSVTIVINPIPPAPIITGPTVYCQDDIPTPLMAETSFSGDVTWYDAPPPATILSTLDDYNPPTNFPGIFNYYVTESVGGCEGPATLVTVTIKPKPDPPTISGTMQYCEGDIPTALTATPSMGGTIEWFDSGLSLLFTGLIFTPTLTIGTNTFIVTETLAGCSSDDTIITITVDPAPYVNVAPSISACYGDAVIIAADTNGYPLTWSSGQTGTPISYFTDTTEWLYVTATNPLCGSSMDSIQVIINALPYVAAFSDTSIGLGAEIKLYASTGASNVTFQWIPPVDECIYPDCSIVFDAPDQATIYIVIATDDNGCQHSDTLFVDIIGLMEIFVPNVFSPNNDGWNDLLEVEGPKLYDFDFRVFDRWGKLMYKSTDQRSGWDGTFDGQELAPQTFVYMVRGETVLGKKIKVQGNVSIIK
ncbi:gliding motility-associated C-terminal domain-containing protein, partial [Crocinitomix catalasitica]|nr:gliding motility-associated C-terminal domain-containing protein [Crocinitomix catalasitica]